MEVRHIQQTVVLMLPMLQEIATSVVGPVEYPPQRLRLLAIEGWLAAPILLDRLAVPKIERLHTLASAFNRALDSVGTSPLHTVVSIRDPARRISGLYGPILEAAERVGEVVSKEIELIGPIAPL